VRRIFILLLCCVCTVFSVSAASGITSAQSQTTVASDGTCQVSLTVTLRMDSPVSELSFPLPEKAKDITVNGVFVSAGRGSDSRNVDLSGIVSAAGVYTLSFRYSLPDAIVADRQGNLNLNLELLSGFAYPVERLDFTVTLPGEFDTYPSFSSTYHQDAIDTLMQISIQNAAITGSVPGGLKDSEKLTMSLPVSAAMFPQGVAKRWSMDTLPFIPDSFRYEVIGSVKKQFGIVKKQLLRKSCLLLLRMSAQKIRRWDMQMQQHRNPQPPLHQVR